MLKRRDSADLAHDYTPDNPGQRPSGAALQVTADDYARAERFLSWNRERYARNADIQHQWIEDEERFWYMRVTTDGDRSFVAIDATTGEEAPAFDHGKVASALSHAMGKHISPKRLPFETFRYVEGRAAIELSLDGISWICRFSPPGCERKSMAALPGELISPDGKLVAFVEGYNLRIRPAVGGDAIALTTDGMEHCGYAGLPEFCTHVVSDARERKAPVLQAVWSPDSRFLLTHRLDERQVLSAHLIQSVPEDGSVRPKLHTFRYAMPGDEHLPTVQLVLVDIAARSCIDLPNASLPCLVQTPFEKRDVWWSACGGTVYYLIRDRFSKVVTLCRFDVVTGVSTEILRETSDTLVHTNASTVFDNPLVRSLSNGDVIWYSQRDGWGHLYWYDGAGTLRNQITSGEWVVRSIVRVDETSSTIYFTASGRESGRDPYFQHLYSVRMDGTELRLLTPEDADHKWPHFISKLSPDDPHTEAQKRQFSRSGRYFVDNYSRPDVPPVFVLRTSDGRLVRKLESADISALHRGGYVCPEPFCVMAADGITRIYGNLYRPSTFDPHRSYPVIDANYPGPQSIRTGKTFVEANFGRSEAQSLAELGFIVVTIDGRGTPNRSKAFLDYSYGRLEKASDLEDHIAGIRELGARYPYIDLDRVGIDGVSGGGFAAAYALLKYPEFYKVGVSAEGNHDQRGYLAPWGETYHGSPRESDYLSCSTLPLAGNLKGKLFLMHGELDDNVSPALTMKLVDALITANKDFDLLIIPNANHAAFFKSPYFIRRKWDFFVRHLLGAEPPSGYLLRSSEGSSP
ncbi:DPP IV N-terminal domain-containing protein [Steroidobacter sp. S1-65]|uniref:DPP IV N-terminal domain-containing protein n=1 Tax=Steroidobacter gossypii TaxID=2805490 RepID=A0ABS1WZY1_9GAMM|nr:DPP IV N-terminal domain-containing protein [Steroidobacter gossypii]MBM0106518.1 DPP IV N-terminal domain-containing protein [Steroidobacter gossypii]